MSSWLRRRFSILHDHVGESEAFRRRFQAAAALVLAYRAVGLTAALVAFTTMQGAITGGAVWIVALSATVIVSSAFCFWATTSFRVRVPSRGWSVEFGANRGWWLDRRVFFEVDLTIAVLANLGLAVALEPGTAFAQFTDVFAVLSITTVALWTGRQGGWTGIRVLALVMAAELAKAPLNGMSWTEVDWGVFGSRATWVLAGWLVSLGVVRILLDYAERIERLRVEDRELARISRSHDVYRMALRRIADQSRIALQDSALAGSTGVWASRRRSRAAAEQIERLGRIADQALVPADVVEGQSTLSDAVGVAMRSGEAARPTMEFVFVDGTHGSVDVDDAGALQKALENLCINAARHSQGTRTTVRLDLVDQNLEVTVRDDGVGMPTAQRGGGIGLVRHLMATYGGEAYRVPVEPGTHWVLRIPSEHVVVGLPS